MDEHERVLDAFRNCITEPKCKNCPWFECDALSNKKIEIPADLALAVMRELEAQEPRVMTLEEVKEARICWIEERDVGIVYPAIYECIGNPSEYGQFSVFTVVSDADILPEELDDYEKIVCDFEEGHRWLWEADYSDVWRCWTSRPTDEQREAVKWKQKEGSAQ